MHPDAHPQAPPGPSPAGAPPPARTQDDAGVPRQPSGLSQAGGILLLIGAILAVAGVLTLLATAFLMAFLDGGVAEATGSDEAAILSFLPWIYVGLAVITAAGAVVGFLAWNKHRQGDVHGAAVLGIVAALLPPVQLLTLLGAILCFVSPEGDHDQAQPQ